MLRRLLLQVSDVTHGASVSSVERALAQLPSVTDIVVSLDHSQVTLSYNADKVTPDEIIQTLQIHSHKSSVVLNPDFDYHHRVQNLIDTVHSSDQSSNRDFSFNPNSDILNNDSASHLTSSAPSVASDSHNIIYPDQTPSYVTFRRVILKIDGMTCSGCVNKVKRALEELSSVSDITVSLDTKLATVLFSGVNVDTLVTAISQVGKSAVVVGNHENEYDRASVESTPSPSLRRVILRIDGMTCINCVNKVTRVLEAVPSASDVQVSLESKLAILTCSASDAITLVDAVRIGSGKVATVLESNPMPPDSVVPSARDTGSNLSRSRRVTLRIEGMSCGGCVAAVTRALNSLPTVSDIDVSLETKLANLTFSGDNEAALLNVVKDETGKVAVVSEKGTTKSCGRSIAEERQPDISVRAVSLRVNGMTCNRCVQAVTAALESVDTVTNVCVSLQSGTATLNYASGDDRPLFSAISATGKTATLLSADNVAQFTVYNEEEMQELSLRSPPLLALSPKMKSLFPSLKLPSPEKVLWTTHLRVSGMTCSSCVGVVEKTLCDISGVSSAKVNLLAGRATVIHDSKIVKPNALCDAVSAAGYKPQVIESIDPTERRLSRSLQSIDFRIDFPTDLQAQDACRVLRALDGVSCVSVDYLTAIISLNPRFSKASVLRALEVNGGFGKMIMRPSQAAELAQISQGASQGATDVIDEEASLWRKKFLMSLAFFIPIFLTGMLHTRFNVLSMRAIQWIHFILATPIQFLCGSGFYRSSYFAIRKGRATMDVLVSLSTSIAYFSSLVVVIFGLSKEGSTSLGHSSMFRVSAMIVTMVLLGKWLESSAKRRAAAGVVALSGLTPDEAVLFDQKDGVPCHTKIPVCALSEGDIVMLIPGDRVPTDGEVIEGKSAVNESMLTGESRPVPKLPGDFVYGGTVNGSGSLVVRTTAVGSDAVLSQIVKLVNDAQTARAPVEALADRISAVFVPVVVLLSVAVFGGWYGAALLDIIPEDWHKNEGKFFFALLFALETMVIACPCALGLATPTAVMVASEVGTGLGVLFRGGAAAVEAVSKVKNVVFDKTGTLTMGQPEVSAVLIAERGKAAVEQVGVILSDLVLLVESQSHHPLAAALVNYIIATTKGGAKSNSEYYKLTSVEEVPGCGIRAVVNRGEFNVRIGSINFAMEGLRREDLLTDAELRMIQRMEQEDGLTLVVAVVNDRLVVVYGLEDSLREEAEAVVEELHRMGLDTVLVTGDSSNNGRSTGLRAGIPEHKVYTGALPWTKVSIVKDHEPACFVGDGVNDAPALTAASVGIAVGAGSPVAAEAASVVVVRADLWSVVDAVDLGRATLRRVHYNFYWAIGYNLVSVPLAAGLLYPWFQVRVPPMVASAAMALSSTCVILSSLALRWYEPRASGSRRIESGTGLGSVAQSASESPDAGSNEDTWQPDRSSSPLLKSDSYSQTIV